MSKGSDVNSFGIGAIKAVFVILLACIVLYGCTSQATSTQKNQTNGSMLTENKSGYQQTQQTIASVLKDGTYTNNVKYATHAGTETVDITISVQNDIVTNASVTPVDADPISTMHINSFNNALPSMVIGKRIDQLNLPTQVAGSSLTTAAFVNYVNGLTGSGTQ